MDILHTSSGYVSHHNRSSCFWAEVPGTQIELRHKKSVPVTRPTLIYTPYPKLFHFLANIARLRKGFENHA